MSKSPVVIIDYGIGNIFSIRNALYYLGYRNIILSDQITDILSARALILPGVGSFSGCIQALRHRNLDRVLNHAVIGEGIPILGICLGMQLFASYSEEGGYHEGLNFIPGSVTHLELPPGYAVPHVGWNNIKFLKKDILFNNFTEEDDFYFDHSYHYMCNLEYIIGHTNYGINIVSAVRNNNIYGVQFHPEKSQFNGLKVFSNFFGAIKKC